jgi:PST family polysaccharide transporter
LSRSLSFKTIALARLWAYIFGYAVLGLTLGYLGYGYWALVYAYIAQQILLSVYFFLKKPYRLAFSLKQDTLKSILRFGFGYSLSQLFTILALRADSFVISRTLGPISLGIYDRSYQLMRFPAFLLATIIDDALFPIFSRFQNDEVKMQSAFNKGLGVLAIVLFPLTIVLIVFAEHIIQVLLGSQWTDATLVFQILCISMYFRSAQRVATATLRAKGAVFISAFAQFVYALMIVVSAYWGSSWGIIGIAIGVALSIVINFILVSICAMKIIQMDNWKLFNPIFKSLPMTMVVGVISCIISIISSKIELNSFVTLLLVAVIAGLFSFIIFKYKPSLLLSQYGNWLMKIVTNKLEKKTRK